MENWFEKLLSINIDKFFDRKYVDLLSKINEITNEYTDSYFDIEKYIDLDQYDDLYITYMAGAATIDSTIDSIKGKKTRIEIFSDIENKKYEYANNKFELLKNPDPINWNINEILKLSNLLSSKKTLIKQNVYRELPKLFKGKSKRYSRVLPEYIPKLLENLIDFINSIDLNEYPLIKIAFVYLSFIKISPFHFDNITIGLVLVDKLILEYYGLPIYIETPLIKFKENRLRFTEAIEQFFKNSDPSAFIELLKDIIIIEISASIKFIKKNKENIKEMFKNLEKTQIKKKFYSVLIKFLIINKRFKISSLANKLSVKDKRTVSKIAKELEKHKIIKNISTTRIKKFEVSDLFTSNFKLFYS